MTDKIQTTLRLDKSTIKWLDKNAKALNLSRQKLVVMILNGMQATEKAADKNTLFQVFENHIHDTLAETMRKKMKK